MIFLIYTAYFSYTPDISLNVLVFKTTERILKSLNHKQKMQFICVMFNYIIIFTNILLFFVITNSVVDESPK